MTWISAEFHRALDGQSSYGWMLADGIYNAIQRQEVLAEALRRGVSPHEVVDAVLALIALEDGP